MAPRDTTGERVSTSLKIAKQLHKRLKLLSVQTERDMGEIVDEALQKYFDGADNK